MPREKLPKTLKAAVSEFAGLLEKAKEATNAANRGKTKLRNAVKGHWTENGIPVGSFIRSDGLEVRFEATESERIDAERVLQLYEDKKISRDQFLRMVSIGKAEAKNVLGGDLVLEYTVKEVGQKADIRVSQTPIEQIDEEFIEIQRKERIRRRKPVGAKTRVSEDVTPKKRRIKIKAKK
jgi:hypothetical protein